MSTADFITVALAVEPIGGDRRQWVHYMPPKGKFAARDGRELWRLDDPQGFVRASFEYSGGQPIPVDYDHALVAANSEARTPAPAAAWITKLEARPDGVWELTEWTPRAAAHIAAREYRFVSPLFRHSVDSRVATRLQAAALTNQPALTSLTAVCSMEASQMPMDMEGLCKALRPLLDLTDGAEPDAIVEALRCLSERATAASASPARDKFVPIAEFESVVTALNAQNRGVSAAAAEIAVDQACDSGKLMPALRGWALALCSENKPAFDAFLQRTSGGLQAILATAPKRGAPPSSHGRVSDPEREMAERCGLSADDLQKYGA